jgi:hypothetical protein
MQAGPLVGSQPALTLGDALVSLSLGVVLYNETVRTGWWLLPELVGLGLIATGVHGLSSSDILASAHPVPQQRDPEPVVSRLSANNDGEQNSCAR